MCLLSIKYNIGNHILPSPKILYLDIETSPKLAYIWKFWKENISPKQVLATEWIMSFSAIWNDENEVIYEENHDEDDFEIVAKLIKLLDEADIVIGHNVKKFDCGTISGRALVAELPPPSPYKVIDTYRVAKDKFNFPSNSLEYLTKVLKVKHTKLSHAKYPGFELWKACLAGDAEAWDEMRVYNIHDTLAVREVYYAMRPWISNHPNVSVCYADGKPRCTACGSHNIHHRGSYHSNSGSYKRFVCVDCGKWDRSKQNEIPLDVRKQLLTSAL